MSVRAKRGRWPDRHGDYEVVDADGRYPDGMVTVLREDGAS